MTILSQLASSYCRQKIFMSLNALVDYNADFVIGNMVRVLDAQNVKVAFHEHRERLL